MKQPTSPSRAALSQFKGLLVAFFLLVAVVDGHAATTALADTPVRATSKVPANVMLAISPEWPTGVVHAYNDEVNAICPGRGNADAVTTAESGATDSAADSVCYLARQTYIGYFDPFKCYNYDTTNRYFYPAGYTVGSSALLPNAGLKTCAGNWSGNYLNWATMQTTDMFRWAMTGGDRSTDTSTLSVLEKARHDGQGGFGQFPLKRIGGGNVGTSPAVQPVLPSSVTPYTSGTLFLRVQGLNTVMWVSKARTPVTLGHPAGGNNSANDLQVPAASVQTYSEEGLCAAYVGPGSCTQVTTASTGTRRISGTQTSVDESGQCPVSGSVSCSNTAAAATGTMQYQYTKTGAVACPSGDVNQTACSQSSIGTRSALLTENGQSPCPAPPSGTTYTGCTNATPPTSTVSRVEIGTSSCVSFTYPAGTTFVSCTPGATGTRSYNVINAGGCPPGTPPAGTTFTGCTVSPPTRVVVYTQSGTVQVVYRETGGAQCNTAPLPTTSPGYVSCVNSSGSRRDVTVNRSGDCTTYTPALSGSQTERSCTVFSVPSTVTVIEGGSCPRGAVAGQTVTSCLAARTYTITEPSQCATLAAPPAGVSYGACTNPVAATRTIVRTENGTCAALAVSSPDTCAFASTGTRSYTTTEPGQCSRPVVAGVTATSCTNQTSPSILVTASSGGQCPPTLPSGGSLVAGSCTNLSPSSSGTRTVVRNTVVNEAGQCSTYAGPGTCVNTASPVATTIRQITGESVTVDPYYVRVKVCDAAYPETQSTCTLYSNGTSLKPTGTMQENALNMRFGAFGYLLDNDQYRDGGVLRARMKDVGPMKAVPQNPPVTNTAAEWSATTGVYVNNPDAADATATGFGATNSGVINYVNKFGRKGGYKSYDPFSEMYAEVIKYFKHITGGVVQPSATSTAPTSTYVNNLDSTKVDGFPVITAWNDPIQYSCQKNFIIGISDANTHKDKNLSGGISNAENEPSAVPADIDTAYNVTTLTNTVGSLELAAVPGGAIRNPQGGTVGSNLATLRNCCDGTAFVAGLAYYAHTTDLRPDLDDLNGTQTITSFFVDVREAGSWGTSGDPRNQLWLAAKYGGFKDVNKNGVFDSRDTWADAAQGTVQGFPVPTNYFAANKPQKLVDGLQSAFRQIVGQTGAGAGVGVAASNLSQTTGDNGIYQVKFDTTDWSGTVSGFTINQIDQTTGAIVLNAATFEAGGLLVTKAAGTGWDTNRVIVTTKPGATQLGQPFRIANLNATQLAALGPTALEQTDVLNYIRGDKSKEETDAAGNPIVGGKYRVRTKLLADVVDSEAVYVGKPTGEYLDQFNPGYSTFKTAKVDRLPTIYVGANGGMLHAFNALVDSTDTRFPGAGQEIMAFIPSLVYAGPNNTPSVDGLRSLTLTTSFLHHYFVNSTPSVRDIDFNKTDSNMTATPDWHTILVGGLGKGGKGFYALDVTDPANLTTEASAASNVLWEYTDEDMGYSYGLPLITKTRKWGWVVMVSSGYNNITSSVAANQGKGFLYILNARTGALLQKIGTGAGSAATPSGFSPLSAYTPSFADYTTDEVYGGDLSGNVWRFDLRSATAAVPSPLLFATLTDGSIAQPITTIPLIEYAVADGKRYVFIGTGRFLDTTDVAIAQQQSFYAIRDGSVDLRFETTASSTGQALPTGVSFPITRANLANNSNLVTGLTAAQITSNPMGWYFELPGVVPATGTAVSRERISLNPKASQGFVTWVGSVPDTNACNPNGVSNQYATTYGGGKTLLYTTNTLGVRTYLSSIQTTALVKSQLVNVGDSVRVLGTDSTGTPFLIGNPLNAFGAGRLLNWREVLQ